MNTLEAIYSRRSCTNFDPDKPVPQDIVQKICEAGTKAASNIFIEKCKISIK